ncbi:hypothetical protein EDB85DRAFT_1895711 [Lactarius pseudohatsudake]|nr:hypothetical protein EDB85DRAFT_1895711 [Lactarius pseudohatsudake]
MKVRGSRFPRLSLKQRHGTNRIHPHDSGSSIWQADDRDDEAGSLTGLIIKKHRPAETHNRCTSQFSDALFCIAVETIIIPPAKAILRERIEFKSSGNSRRRGKLRVPPGLKRVNFYREVVDKAEDIPNDTSKPDDEDEDLIAASNELQNRVKGDCPSRSPSTEKLGLGLSRSRGQAGVLSE